MIAVYPKEEIKMIKKRGLVLLIIKGYSYSTHSEDSNQTRQMRRLIRASHLCAYTVHIILLLNCIFYYLT